MFFFVIFVFISFVLTQTDPCNVASGTNCSGCTSQQNCGWCSSIQACITGTVSGPAGLGLPVSICAPKQWYFGATADAPHGCPVCSIYTSCTDCTDQDACGWNANTSQCVPATNPGASSICPCQNYTQCTDCRRANCVFCASDGMCYPNPIPAGSCASILASCDCPRIGSCQVCTQQQDICGWCPSSGSCRTRGVAGACGEALVSQCPVPVPWSGGTFFGGIILGLILTLLAFAGLYAYRTYGSNQYSQVG